MFSIAPSAAQAIQDLTDSAVYNDAGIFGRGPFKFIRPYNRRSTELAPALDNLAFRYGSPDKNAFIENETRLGVNQMQQ